LIYLDQILVQANYNRTYNPIVLYANMFYF